MTPASGSTLLLEEIARKAPEDAGPTAKQRCARMLSDGAIRRAELRAVVAQPLTPDTNHKLPWEEAVLFDHIFIKISAHFLFEFLIFFFFPPRFLMELHQLRFQQRLSPHREKTAGTD